MDDNKAQLIFLVAFLVFLLVLGLVATALFIRQWRREHQDKQK